MKSAIIPIPNPCPSSPNGKVLTFLFWIMLLLEKDNKATKTKRTPIFISMDYKGL